jgi:outer membrane protein assembly factor BamA
LDQEKKSVNVDYFIQEGQRTFVRSIVFEGMPPELEQVVSQAISNKVGQPFNPVLLLDDLKKVTNELQERGYYFAEVTNANNDTLVLFSKNASDVDIRFTVQTGPLLRLNRVIYLGNIKTRKEVLSKKILIDRGDIITPSQTKDFETSLSSTGLFNSVSVTPMRTNLLSRASTDLIVKVS